MFNINMGADQAEAKSFYQMFDKYLAELDAMGAAIVVTADHGMKPKHHADGSPSVVYVQDFIGRNGWVRLKQG